LVAVIVSCIGFAGFLWVVTVGKNITHQLFGSVFVADVARALGYGMLLLIPFGLVALLLHDRRFQLWRGVAISLAVGGAHALIAGLLLAIDRQLLWPGLPDAVPPLVTLAFAAGVLLLSRRRFFGVPARATLLGAAMGILVSLGWAAVGSLGTPAEFLLAILEGVANGLLSALAVALIFYYEPEMLVERPFWSAVLVGAVFMGLGFSLFAVRGWGTQASVLSLAFLPMGLIAGVLLGLHERPDLQHTWWAVFAFFSVAFLTPFALTEGLEGDWMQDVMPLAWGPAMFASLGIASALSVGLLATRRLVTKATHHSLPTLLTLFFSLIVLLGIYIGIGQPGIQPETFFVVMANQADTSFARNITDLSERRVAVYATLVDHAEATQAELRAFLDERHVEYTPYYLVNGLRIEGTSLLRARIAARPDVARILNNPRARPLPEWVQGFSIPAAEFTVPGGLATGVDQIDAERVWSELGVTGEGIVVGHADSGVDWNHSAIHSQYLGSGSDHNYTWFDPWEGTSEPTDTNGHGTHTLGIVLGQGGIGVAPGARWIACRNLARNLGNPGFYLDCMQFLFAPYPQGSDPFTDGDPLRGADLTNNSWGCPPEEGCDAITLSIAVEHLRNAGQMFVVSAGNEGPQCDTIWAPANADAAFSVGAIDPLTGQITDFSSRGPVLGDGSGRIKPDVVAPGYEILSAVPGGGYTPLPGTSMAGPHVAGLVALLWSADPSLRGDIDQTERIITETAHYHPAPDLCGGDGAERNNVYGYGSIDALAAVRMALAQP